MSRQRPLLRRFGRFADELGDGVLDHRSLEELLAFGQPFLEAAAHAVSPRSFTLAHAVCDAEWSYSMAAEALSNALNFAWSFSSFGSITNWQYGAAKLFR